MTILPEKSIFDLSELTPGGLGGAAIASAWSRQGAIGKFYETVPPRWHEFTFSESYRSN